MRLSVFALVCLFLTACATREKGRERISFNKEWRFALTEKQANASAPDTDDSNWRVLNLPYDWSIEGISEEAELLDSRMLEIKDFLQDIESMLQEDSEDSMSTLLIKGEKNRISVEDFYKNHEVYPELLLNLKELTTFFQNQYEGLEILLEFEDGGIQLDTKVVANILRQLTINIMSAVEDYNISMILIEGKVTDDKILLTLNCMCDDGPVDTFKISYDIDRI